NRRKRQRLVANVIGFFVLVVMVFPTYWMVNTAFKPGRDILTLTPKFFPSPWTLSNFDEAVHRQYFWDNVKNSVIVVSVVVVLSLVIGFLAALAIARFSFYGRRAFIAVIIGVQMIPTAALIIPIYILFARANQVDRLSGVIIAYLTFVLPFTVWTLRGFVMGIPRELEEAAMVDGCTRMGAFLRILVPLIAPGLVATSIFAFVQAWNEFIFAYVLLSSQEHQTLTVWLATFTTLRGTDWGPLMAAATLTSLPVVIFFAIVQRRVAFGLTAGAVRG
ncbi:MAG TPA: carbohydrate ABC transporter permease, partial [Gaiellaceae bacterium]|nr:carbohydrate ABC transporter permease [Gaiellaceae bacterium]